MSYSLEQKKSMITIVSSALRAAVVGGEYSILRTYIGLDSKSGCFVTLKTHGQLRGCIGCFVSEEPLYKTLAVYARASALEDPRFSGRRISEEELAEVDIDISVLSPLIKCDNPEGIILGEDGIYIVSQYGSGCFLPQVATETGWSVDEFWGNCCAQKAGLAYDAWKNGGIELYTFKADVIEGKYSL